MYKIILADPPWQYKDKASSGKRGAEHKYPVMSLDDIKSLPVNNLTVDDSILFMWVTMPLLQEGLDVIKAWGFDYKTCAFVWVKTNKKAGTDFMGMGNWSRSNAELLLLGTKGKPKRVNKGVRQILETECPEVIRSPMIRHSQKPVEFMDRIVELCGDMPRVELFARTKTDYWDVWGNEVKCSPWADKILTKG